MGEQSGLRVTVQGGGLPDEVVEQISSAVKDAVRRVVAGIDLLSGYREDAEAQRSLDFGDHHTAGIVYIPPEKSAQ